MSSAASFIDVTLAHAIAYLTRSLIKKYPATTILKLQTALKTNLTEQYAPTWTPSEPLRGSGRRCLTLSPNTLPPRPVHNACVSANVEWSEWVQLLGATEFDMFIDPGCISVRFGNWDVGKPGKIFTVWSGNAAATPSPIVARSKVPALNLAPTKTFAQQVLENDSQDENELFAMVANELRDPTWITPILTQFPNVPSLSEFSPSSRSSSPESSSSSSGFSYPDSDSASSFASEDSLSKMSRRERARQAKVFIDTTKNEVTNYDGGKTTVLTGGVMLGGSSSTKKPASHSPTSSIASRHSHSSSNSSSSWRASRV